MKVKVAQSCLTLGDPMNLHHPWNFPGQNTGVGSHSLLQGIFLTQGSNPGLPHSTRFFTVWAISEAIVKDYYWLFPALTMKPGSIQDQFINLCMILNWSGGHSVIFTLVCLPFITHRNNAGVSGVPAQKASTRAVALNTCLWQTEQTVVLGW